MPQIPSIDEIVAAYMSGLFPMDIDGRIGLYQCDPRTIIPVEGFRVPRSVRRSLRDQPFISRVDTAFEEVVAHCGGHRHDGEWLTPRLARIYSSLHALGLAYSVETWQDDVLVGGVFGVTLGGLTTSESMFHRVDNAGNAALVACHQYVQRSGTRLWDIQMLSPHTERFGAIEISSEDYLERLADALVI